MPDGLDLLPLAPRGLFGRRPECNAFVELHNGLVAAWPSADFGPDDRERIGRDFGLDLRHTFAAERADLYRTFLERVVSRSPDLSDASLLRALAHVEATLAVRPDALARIHADAFGTAAREALADAHLAPDESAALESLREALGVNERRAAVLLREVCLETVQAAIGHALADGVLSPDERADVRRIADGLGVTLSDETRAVLDDADRRDAIQTKPMPRTHVPLPHRFRGERGHADAEVTWWATSSRDVQTAANRAGPAGALGWAHLPRGWRNDTHQGTVVLTSLRVVLCTHPGEESWLLDDGLTVTAFADGFALVHPHTKKAVAVRTADRRLADLVERAASARADAEAVCIAAQWAESLGERRGVDAAYVVVEALRILVSPDGPSVRGPLLWSPLGLALGSSWGIQFADGARLRQVPRGTIERVRRHGVFVEVFRHNRQPIVVRARSDHDSARLYAVLTSHVPPTP